MRHKRVHFFYLPLLFSFLSCCCMYFFMLRPLLQRERFQRKEVNWYKEGVWPWIIPERQFLDINFTGDTVTDKIRLEFGRLYIRELYASADTVHAVNFRLSSKCKYKLLVEVLDMLNIEDIPYYAPSDEGIKVLYYCQPRDTVGPKIQSLQM